jgi:hypothetical protein
VIHLTCNVYYILNFSENETQKLTTNTGIHRLNLATRTGEAKSIVGIGNEGVSSDWSKDSL